MLHIAAPPLDLPPDSAEAGKNHGKTSAMSKKLSQEDLQWPSTQRMLLDHLRRIVEGVACSGDPPDVEWTFGFGEDRLVSWKPYEEEDLQVNRQIGNSARLEMFFACLAAEARDRPGGPGHEFVQKAASSVSRRKTFKALGKVFADRPLPHEFFRSLLPESADADTLQQVYAFEMLNKLGMVADRSKTEAVREILLLENVPERIDDYMAEAAACFRYGFDKACLAVCRAALEQILKWRMASDGKPVSKNLHDLIESAREWKYLDGELARAAHDIRKWGNGAVHDSQKGNIPIPRNTRRSFTLALAKEALLNSKRILRRLCS